MPNGGSVNQTESSDLTTMSFGALSGLPSNLSIRTVMLPSYSVRVTRRVSCSHVTRRPRRSRALPLANLDRRVGITLARLPSSERGAGECHRRARAGGGGEIASREFHGRPSHSDLRGSCNPILAHAPALCA